MVESTTGRLSERDAARESIMTTRTATAEWRGGLEKGFGRMRLGSGAFEGTYDFRSRMGDGTGTNPEELIGAAHAGCFSMALAHQLTQMRFTVVSIETTAKVRFEDGKGGWSIPSIDLIARADVPGISPALFAEQARQAKENCPVSKALAGVDIHLTATLKQVAA
jgi:osmotically inducible protein OsmC